MVQGPKQRAKKKAFWQSLFRALVSVWCAWTRTAPLLFCCCLRRDPPSLCLLREAHCWLRVYFRFCLRFFSPLCVLEVVCGVVAFVASEHGLPWHLARRPRSPSSALSLSLSLHLLLLLFLAAIVSQDFSLKVVCVCGCLFCGPHAFLEGSGPGRGGLLFFFFSFAVHIMFLHCI